MTELPAVADVVPHRGEVLLLDRFLEHDAESTTTRVVVGATSWLQREDGSAGCWLALEYMSQSVAAHEGLCAWLEGRPAVRGFLASASGIRVHRPHFEAGEVLHVRTRLARGRPGLGVLSHNCSIHGESGSDDAALFAEGRLSISVPKTSPESAGA